MNYKDMRVELFSVDIESRINKIPEWGLQVTWQTGFIVREMNCNC